MQGRNQTESRFVTTCTQEQIKHNGRDIVDSVDSLIPIYLASQPVAYNLSTLIKVKLLLVNSFPSLAFQPLSLSISFSLIMIYARPMFAFVCALDR